MKLIRLNRLYRLAAFGIAVSMAWVICGTEALALGPKPPVPELDGGSLHSAVAIIAGGFLVLRSRLRRSIELL